MLRVLAFGLIAIAPAAALACPDPDQAGRPVAGGSAELSPALEVEIKGGGTYELSECAAPVPAELEAAGSVSAAPDLEFEYSRTSDDNIEFRVGGLCADSVLLLRSPSGTWYYDDDDLNGADPVIRLRDPFPGMYDIWVGAYEGELCNASVAIQTFPAGETQAQTADPG